MAEAEEYRKLSKLTRVARQFDPLMWLLLFMLCDMGHHEFDDTSWFL